MNAMELAMINQLSEGDRALLRATTEKCSYVPEFGGLVAIARNEPWSRCLEIHFRDYSEADVQVYVCRHAA
jgi:hypothetical protein